MIHTYLGTGIYNNFEDESWRSLSYKFVHKGFKSRPLSYNPESSVSVEKDGLSCSCQQAKRSVETVGKSRFNSYIGCEEY